MIWLETDEGECLEFYLRHGGKGIPVALLKNDHYGWFEGEYYYPCYQFSDCDNILFVASSFTFNRNYLKNSVYENLGSMSRSSFEEDYPLFFEQLENGIIFKDFILKKLTSSVTEQVGISMFDSDYRGRRDFYNQHVSKVVRSKISIEQWKNFLKDRC